MLLPGQTIILLGFLTGVLSDRASYQNTAPVFITGVTLDRLQSDGIPEDTPIGTRIARLYSVDHEGDHVTYSLIADDTSLINADNYFSVDPLTGVVSLKSQLDREKLAAIPVVFTVTDIHGSRSHIHVSIRIKDANDNTPMFMEAPYTAQVSESAAPGTVVFSNIIVKDLDVGDNAIVDLSCHADTPQERDVCAMFSIKYRQISGKETKGVIELLSGLDYESKKEYFITIKAKDHGPLPRTVTTSMLIQVVDSQDVPPKFLYAPYHVDTKENAPSGTSIVTMWAQDQDEGNPNPIKFSIVDDPLNFFTIDEATYSEGSYKAVLRSSGNIDREMIREMYFCIVKAEELVNGEPSGPGVETVVAVKVEDENDNAPTFNQQGPYIITMPESLPVNSSLPGLSMVVSDIDTSLYNKFELSIEDDKYFTFSVSPTWGQNRAAISILIRNAANLDYEQEHFRTQTFKVVARETGVTEPHVSSATVTVKLQDVNDHRPHFAKPKYDVRIREDMEPGVIITTVTASDKDAGENGVLKYELDESSSHKFTVDRRTGDIKLTEKYDFEKDLTTFLLTLRATDGAGESEETKVNVTGENINDEAPVFDPSYYESTLEEDSIVLTPIVILKAVDAEGDLVTYSISDGNTEDNAFMVDSSGKLEVSRTIGFQETPDRQGYFLLEVKASDEDGNYNLAEVKVNIRDKNDNAPVFTKAAYDGEVSETAGRGTYVTTVQATDNDDGENAEIRYRIHSGHYDKFVIDEDSGVVTVAYNNELDIDDNGDLYNIIVHAVDNGYPTQTGTTQVTVIINDANNKYPEFTQDVYQGIAEENAPAGTSITMVTAIDTDSNADIQYTIRSETYTARDDQGYTTSTSFNYRNTFGVGRTSGMVSLMSRLEPDDITEVTFVVEAQDQNAESGTQTATTTVKILIKDANSQYLQYEGGGWTLEDPYIYIDMKEELELSNDPIYNLVAIDPVSGAQVDNFTEVAGSDPDDYFTVNEYTGHVYLNKKLDYEELTNKDLSLQVMAYSTNGKDALATVIMRVEDTNDNNPVFLSPEYTFTLSESTRFPTQIGYIKATDADSGDFGKVSYSLTGSGADQFYIYPDTGYLTVAEGVILDAENIAEYNFMVEAIDNPSGEGIQRSTQAQVIINVKDENEIAPEFEESTYNLYVSDTSKADASLGRVQATDSDLDNTQITYTITSGNTELFRIESNTGVIRANKDLEGYASSLPYTLVITASDNGDPPRSSQITVNMFVTSGVIGEEGAPRFVFPNINDYTVRMPEEMAVGSQVINVIAEPTESGAGMVTYGLVDSEDKEYFSINSTDGTIVTTKILDREVKSRYELIVVADDRGKESSIRIFVDLTDIDDNDPSFDACENVNYGDIHYVSVGESLPPPQTVTVVSACDGDDEPYNDIYYFIVCGNIQYDNGDKPFTIDKNTGTISTQISLDREERSEYTLYVKADDDEFYAIPDYDDENCNVDDNDPSILPVHVTVGNIDDSAPNFGTNASFTSSILAETHYHSEVIQVKAYDPDSEIFYYLSPIEYTNMRGEKEEVEDAFTIDSESGMVYSGWIHYMDHVGGYFSTSVIVEAGKDTIEETLVIYVVDQTQVIEYIFYKQPDYVMDIQQQFLNDVAAKLGPSVYIGSNSLRYHTIGTQTGKDKLTVSDIDYDRTDLCFHIIKDSRVMGADSAQDLIEDAEDDGDLDSVYDKYNVNPQLDRCLIAMTTEWWDDYWWLWWILIALAILMFVMALIIIIGILLCWRGSKRKIRRYKPYSIILDPITEPNKSYEWQETTVRMT